MHFKRVVVNKGVPYYVSTTTTLYRGFETMIFMCKENKPLEQLTDEDVIWSDLYVENHLNFETAKKRHNEICENIGEYVG